MEARWWFSVVLLFTSFHKLHSQTPNTEDITIFLAGDVMLGRGIDQIFQQSVDPVLYESYVKDARVYVQLAEKENGEIPVQVDYGYVWGEALEVWEEKEPSLKLINLETSITTNGVPWKSKGIHYRMHPENTRALIVAGIDHVSLANNHVMDWGRKGLAHTLEALSKYRVAWSGAGRDKSSAEGAAVLQHGSTRVLVFSIGAYNSGIPSDWAADQKHFGVNFLGNFNNEQVERIRALVQSKKSPGDIVILSIHWGGNWGYEVSKLHQEFAHQLIDAAGVDLVFGHSSHHPLGIEVYQGKLIIYGAGDFLNDYEGITGYETYRGELSLMYFPTLDVRTGALRSLEMVPMEIKKLQLKKASKPDSKWLKEVLDREGKRFGTSLRRDTSNSLWLEW